MSLIWRRQARKQAGTATGSPAGPSMLARRSSRTSSKLKLRPAAVAVTAAAALLVLSPATAQAAKTGTPLAGHASGRFTVLRVSPQRGTAAGPAPQSPAALVCEPPTGWFNRTQACALGASTVYFYNTQGQQIGYTSFVITQAIPLSIKSTSFTETFTVAQVATSGVNPQWYMDLSATCGSGCTATGGLIGNPLAQGTTTTITYNATVGANQVQDPTPQYQLILFSTDPNVTGPPPFTWSYPETVRCDNTLKGQSAGCVFAAYTPKLTLSRATYGASAALIQWGQQNLSGHWGLQGSGQPLTRLANTATSNTNRSTICKKAWTSEGSKIGGDFGDTDSCDEFPFAATYQSGALHGVTSGAQCAQVTAVETGIKGQTEAQRWNSVNPLGTPTGKEACVRGHVPNKLNGLTGGRYGNFVNQQRLLDKDPFWVAVTS